MPVATCRKCGISRLYDDDVAGRTVTCSQCLGQVKVGNDNAPAKKKTGKKGKGSSATIPQFLMADERPAPKVQIEPPPRFAVTLVILGLGAFLLPHAGLQFRVLNLLGDDLPMYAAVMACVGGAIIAFNMKAKPPLAIATAGTIGLMLMLGWSNLPVAGQGVVPIPMNQAGVAAPPPGPQIPVMAVPGPPPGFPHAIPEGAIVTTTTDSSAGNPFGATSNQSTETSTESPSVTPIATPTESPFRKVNGAATPVATTSSGSDFSGWMAEIDPARDTLNGQWQKQSGGIVSPASTNAAQIVIHKALPKAYRMTLVAEKVGGADDSLCIGFPMGPRTGMISFDGWNIPATAISPLNGRTGDNNPSTHRGKVLQKGQNTIVLTVQDGQVKVSCNGRPVIEWKGPATALGLDLRFWKPCPAGHAFLGSWQTSFRISSLDVEAL
jgi:hypothetical protein